MRNTTKLRNLLTRGTVLAASVFDPLSARVAELAGFEALHLSGFGVEATQLGAPDMGLMTMTELAGHAARIIDGVDIPLLSDIDTGFGGANNIRRTIRAIERAGAAGVHIEDQAFPKRCPVLEGRVIVSRAQAVGRIKAAVDARADADFFIVARTDSDVTSIDEAIERSNLYLEAGADMAMPSFLNVDGKSYFAMAPAEQMALFRRLTDGIEGKVMSLGVSPPQGFSAKDMGDAGFAFIMFAGPPLSAVMNALAGLYQEVRATGTDSGYFARHPGPYIDPMAMMNLLKLDHYVDVDRRFSPAD